MSAPFDPRAWLANFVQAGGGFILTPAGKLWFVTEAVDGFSLTIAMSQIVGQPDRLASVRDAIGEVRI